MPMRILQHNVPDEYLKNIGDMTVSFSLLEINIQIVIWLLLDSDQRVGQIITAEISFKNSNALLSSLYLERYGKDNDYNKLQELLKRTKKIEERRNQIVHSYWSVSGDPSAILRIKTTAKEKYGIKFSRERITTADLSTFAINIKKLAYDFQTFMIILADKK